MFERCHPSDASSECEPALSEVLASLDKPIPNELFSELARQTLAPDSFSNGARSHRAFSISPAGGLVSQTRYSSGQEKLFKAHLSSHMGALKPLGVDAVGIYEGRILVGIRNGWFGNLWTGASFSARGVVIWYRRWFLTSSLVLYVCERGVLLGEAIHFFSLSLKKS
jgi:hypothetical protein